MSNIASNKYLTLIFRLVLGVVFIYASIDKIIHIDQFARAIYFYHIIPGWVVNVMAIFMPWVELFAGVCLIVGFYPRGAAALIGTMLVMFLIALAIVYARGVDINCGCFSVSDRAKSSAITLIWRDFILLVMTIQVFFGRSFLSFHKIRHSSSR